MATHPRILAWKIPWTEEPGGLWWAIVHRVVKELDTAEHTAHTRSTAHTRGTLCRGPCGRSIQGTAQPSRWESTEREDLWARIFIGGQGGVHNKSHKGFCWCA